MFYWNCLVFLTSVLQAMLYNLRTYAVDFNWLTIVLISSFIRNWLLCSAGSTSCCYRFNTVLYMLLNTIWQTTLDVKVFPDSSYAILHHTRLTFCLPDMFSISSRNWPALFPRAYKVWVNSAFDTCSFLNLSSLPVILRTSCNRLVVAAPNLDRIS